MGALARAALPSVPGITLLPGVRKDPAAGRAERLARRRSDVRIDAEAAGRYAELCGFAPRDAVPLTYPHLLGFDLQLGLMAEPAFPAPALGLVHVENRITASRRLHPGEVVDVEVSVGPARPHRSGRVFDFVTTVCDAESGEVAWEESSSYLHRSNGQPDAPGLLDLPQVPPTGTVWKLPADLGRRYASVAGDWNPIHVHPWTAKAFGFPRAIAHGMWTMARCVASFENRLPPACTVEVGFRKPVLLPGSVAFGSRLRPDGGLDFSLSRPGSDTWHLLGSAYPGA
ncbi:MaoC/PaaZ C-terminal domain-containing protein [Nocardioides sp. GY 10127]|uniref:MaoC family dehydratase n=1 Tax=Nocardioides sp. GY 10127 TaxID=2569762 RepID=UPI001F0F0381|nr:MaoC/PaaZ C-terminal domain-containing protein [Nocardioides sp. GY 10127]